MTSHSRQKTLDIPTLVAVSIVAWALANMLHEIIGHAGAAVLLGIQVRAASTTTVAIAWDQIQSIGEYRVIHAGGTVVNLLTGALALLALRRGERTSVASHYFLWLFATFSAIVVTMNLVSAPLIGGGDWIEFLTGLEPRDAWKACIIGTGGLLAVIGYVLPLRFWMPCLKGSRLLQVGITVIPLITVIVAQTLSLAKSPFVRLPPESNHLVASVFAYFHFVLWVVLVNLIPGPRSSEPVQCIHLPRSSAWLVLGLFVLVFYVAVLGPGIGSFEGDPRLR
jgi:hypothetical protein